MLDRLNRICKQLIQEQPFYGLLLVSLQKEFTTNPRFATAGVGLNGLNYRLYINEDFFSSLSDDHAKGLLIHELQHIASFHITEFKHLKEHEIANIAMDIEINQVIPTNLLPPGGCTLEKFQKYGLKPREGTNIYYNKLLQAGKDKFKSDNSSMVTDGNGDPANKPQHDWEDIQNAPESQQKLINQQLARIMQNVVDEVKKQHGNVPYNIEQILERFKPEPPKFDWKSYLRRYVGNSNKISVKKTARKKSLRFSENFGIRKITHSHVLLAIDSSASVSDNEIKEFMNEVHHMYKTGNEFTIIFCDTHMQEPIKYKPNQEIVIKQRGGTDFNPPLEHYLNNKNKYTTLIYLTDGEAPLPTRTTKNMLWVLSSISSDAEHLKQSGKVIKLN